MKKSDAKTIEIFLPSGDPTGIKVASITSRTVQVTFLPRPMLDKAKTRGSLDGVGVYILVGYSDEFEKQEVYIGETESCMIRLLQHNRDMNFWHYALVINSRTNQFTKTHVKYLEWLCYDEGKKANRCAILNSSIPTKPHVSEPMEADIHDSFETLVVLTSALGLPLFEPVRGKLVEDVQPNDHENVFYIRSQNSEASCIYTNDGLVILAGSKFAKELTADMEKKRSHLKLRDRLINDGILADKGDHYELQEDSIFRNPSNAGASVTGRSKSGWMAWKRKDGKTLDDVYRKSV